MRSQLKKKLANMQAGQTGKVGISSRAVAPSRPGGGRFWAVGQGVGPHCDSRHSEPALALQVSSERLQFAAFSCEGGKESARGIRRRERQCLAAIIHCLLSCSRLEFLFIPSFFFFLPLQSKFAFLLHNQATLSFKKDANNRKPFE